MTALQNIDRPFRFGVVAGGPQVVHQWTATARRLESAGFDTLLVPDTRDGPAPFPAAAAASAVTSTLRVGTFVAVAGLRPPAVLAWEAATVQELSHGRFELGLGLGRPSAFGDAERLGVRLERTGQVDRLRAVLAAVRDLPAAQRPPVLIAAAGPRMLRLAGVEADTVTLGLPPIASPQEQAEAAATVRAAAQNRSETPELAANLVLAGEGEPAPWLETMLGVSPAALIAAGSAAVLAGTPTQMADTLLRRREQAGISYITGGLHLVEALAPVIDRLSGR